jgi:tRNA uridine 5-carboxymethylaminomethyl modification enzyme
MFTSRAEYRILLRQDNADLRLTELGHKIGLADDERIEALNTKKTAIKAISEFVSSYSVAPEDVNSLLAGVGSADMRQKMKLDKVLARPHVGLELLATGIPELKSLLSKYSKEVIESAEIELKYEGYIEKEMEVANKMQKLEEIRLETNFDYSQLKSLSIEARQKLTKIKPSSLGQAQRISGVSPSDIAVLMVHMGR